MAADWTSLLPELVRQITDKFLAIEDLAAFTSVCKSFRPKEHWRRHQTGMTSRPPWLLLCCQEDQGHDGDDDDTPINHERRGLLSMYKNRKRFDMNLPELDGRHCWGSTYGWIVTLGLDLQLHLFNPLTRRRILLPPLTYQQEWDEDNLSQWEDEDEKKEWIRKYYIDRALLIKRPPSSYSSSQFDDFLVLTTGPLCELRVVRPDTWASVKFVRGDGPGFVFDVASHNGEIYMLGNRGLLYICANLDGPDVPQVVQYMPIEESFSAGDKYYLVESLGDLLLVVRSWHPDFDDQPRSTYCFLVFKLDSKMKKWIRIHDLGDRALFVGDCQSIALHSPAQVNCQPNCIYFNDDNYEQFGDAKGGHDMGVYDYKAKSFHPFYEGADCLSHYSTPTWFIPSFT